MIKTNPQHPIIIVASRWRAVYKYYYFIIRGVKPLQLGKSFADGFIMRLTDKPDNPENTIIIIEPCQNKDGAPQLAITIYQATGSEQRTQTNEQGAE